MRAGARLVTLAAIVLVAGLSVGVELAIGHWNAVTSDKFAKLGRVTTVEESDEGVPAIELPAPAARYFRFALGNGQRHITSAIATQQAEFFINSAWRPLTATQTFAANPPGFVWDARILMAPLMSALVRDAYVDGVGSMQASILGVYTLADQTGAPEMNAGSLQRFLAEAVWLPTALLPGKHLSWSPVDDEVAVATISHAGTRVSLRFHVNARGEVTTIEGDRFAENNGTYTLRPWTVSCSDYRDMSGFMVPGHCEVSWITGKRAEPYWRGSVTAISYTFADN